MNVSQGYYITNTILKDRKDVPDLSKEEFNDLLLASNDMFFRKLVERKKTEAKEANMIFERYIDQDPDIYPLITSADIVLTTGVGSLPADYYHYVGIASAVDGSGSVLSHVEFTTYHELLEMANNVFGLLDYHPKCSISSSSSLTVYPTDITTVGLRYVKKPSTPVYAETLNGTTGLNTYDSGSSTQWDFGDRNHIEIVMEMLSMLDIASSKEEVRKYLEK
jgi:hypothetical protein